MSFSYFPQFFRFSCFAFIVSWIFQKTEYGSIATPIWYYPKDTWKEYRKDSSTIQAIPDFTRVRIDVVGRLQLIRLRKYASLFWIYLSLVSHRMYLLILVLRVYILYQCVVIKWNTLENSGIDSLNFSENFLGYKTIK